MLLIDLCLLLIIIEYSICATSIKTYPKVDLKENVPINTTVINLMKNVEEMKRLKLVLLNLSGFETNLFEIWNDLIFTKDRIDREEFLFEKRCFDRLYCLIELHILVNNGEEYWVIPIHIVDENDNKPEFQNNLIELKYVLNNNLNEYKIPFEGGIDIDEGRNGEIDYFLDCSKGKRKEILFKEKTLNCFPLFDLIIFSKSLINQNDQLGLKLNSLFLSKINEYNLILYGFNFNEKTREKEMINSIKIKIQIQRFEKEKFQFIITKELKKGMKIGQIKSLKENLFISKTNEIEINYLTGELFLLNNQINENKINLIIESFDKLKLIEIEIFFRLLNKLNSNLLFNYQIKSSIKQIQNLNQFQINQNLLKTNEILFFFSISSIFYPLDQFNLTISNSSSSSSSSSFLLFPLLNKTNEFILQIQNLSFFQFNQISLLTIQIKHQLTNQYLNPLIIQFDNYQNLCLQNQIFHLFDLQNQTNSITKLQVIETNLNLFSFSTFFISQQNSNELIFEQCRMKIDNISILNQSQYRLCSSSNQCFLISLINKFSQKTKRRIFTLRPIEMTILSLSFVFILAMITIIFIICRLRGFQLCLTMKNYLFYGKKYGINRAQRLSSTKITQRIQSIVVRESQSPSIEHIKSLEPEIFNINQYFQQETIPSIHLYQDSPQILSSSSLQPMKPSVQDTQQLLQMITSNEDGDLSRLASEV